MKNQFKYDAFISYRHAELDKFVAEKLHKQLEAFSLPKSVAKKRQGQKTKIERVFRDKEELPLTSNLEDPIVQALQNSEWLIVICSPRLRESVWCKKEIETFISLRGREHVLAVLIEGEPAESFPDELLYKVEIQTNPDGTTEEVKIPVEPLAADVRGTTKKEMRKAMKTEVLRLLAAMFQMTYDDLRQRHKERRMRRIMTASFVGGALCLLFGIYSTATALRIQSQKEQIEAQAEQIMQQSNEIMQQNEELALRQARSLAELATQYLEDGDRAGALKTAVEALTESGGIKLPYTAEAQYILAESLRAYDTGNIYKAEYQYETAGRIEYLEESSDSDTLVIYDETNTLTLFGLEKREVIDTFDSQEYNSRGISGCTFLGEDKFAYINAEETICIYDLEQKAVTNQIPAERAYSLSADEEGKYLAARLLNDVFVIYDSETLEEVGRTPQMENSSFLCGPYISEEGIFACAYPIDGEYTNFTYALYFIDLNTMQVVSIYPMNTRELVDLEMRDGVAYVTAAQYGNSYTSCDAYISAVSIESGTLLWEHEQKGYWPYFVDLPMNEGATDLLFATNNSVSMVNMQTGVVSFTEPLTSSVIESNVYRDYNTFLLFCQNGEMIAVDKDYAGSFDLSYRFECKTTSNDEILHSAYGITVLERNDNKITVYTSAPGRDVVKIDEEINYPEETEIKKGDEASEIARSLGLDKPEYVWSLYYSEDEKYCFIQYWDYSFVIYDVEARKICNTMDEAYPTQWCLGKDAAGYCYLLGYYGCYILNENMEPVMWLPEAKGVDLENRKVYLAWYENYYEAPVYSVEELIQMAEDNK